jgi:hypothetical protein
MEWQRAVTRATKVSTLADRLDPAEPPVALMLAESMACPPQPMTQQATALKICGCTRPTERTPSPCQLVVGGILNDPEAEQRGSHDGPLRMEYG